MVAHFTSNLMELNSKYQKRYALPAGLGTSLST